MSNKVKDIQEFIVKFNKDLKKAFIIYEEKQKKNNLKNLKKSFSQNNNLIKRKKDKFPTVPNNGKLILKKYSSNKNLFIKPPEWKPPKGVGDYFEEFKRLKSQYQLNSWEKVYKYNIIIKLLNDYYRKELCFVKKVMKKKKIYL